MRGVGCEPPHLLLGLALTPEGDFQPLQHSVEGVGELVDLHLPLVNRKTDIQITGIYALGGFPHIGQRDQCLAQCGQIEEQAGQQSDYSKHGEDHQLLQNHIPQRSGLDTHLQQDFIASRPAQIHENREMLAAVRGRNKPVASGRFICRVDEQFIILLIG
ncbi:hypothetical protein D3C80_1317070 [compost metagenome]